MNLNSARHLLVTLLLCSSAVGLSASDPAPTTATPHRGVASATSYSNDYFDLHATLPAGWTGLTDDELVASPDVAFISGPIRALRSGTPIEALFVIPLAVLVNTETSRETGATANVIVYARSLQGRPASVMPTIAAMEREDMLRTPGIKPAGPPVTAVLGGKMFRRFDVTGPLGLHQRTHRLYLAESRGHAIYIMSTSFSAADESAIEELLANFSFTPRASSARR